jgi:hypothetical protein
MADILEILLPWAASTYGLFVLLAWDEGRLSTKALARAWPPATRRLALVYFGALSLPVHFWRTRRSFLGVLQGLAWTVAFVALNQGLADGLDELVERLSPGPPA